MTDKTRLNFNISKAEHEQLKQTAKNYGMSVAQYCRVAILTCPPVITRGGDSDGKQETAV